MDGFIGQAEFGRRKGCIQNPDNPLCSRRAANPDVMGYHDGQDIPNYWAYARNFVLQDHMFEPNESWSLPAHLFMVSEWSARCPRKGDPMSCVNALQNPINRRTRGDRAPDYAWTDLTYLLHARRVSWRYYVFTGTEPDCEDDADDLRIRSSRERRPRASGIRCPTSTPSRRTASSGTSQRSRSTSRRRRTARSRRSPGSIPTGLGLASIRPPLSRTGRRT